MPTTPSATTPDRPRSLRGTAMVGIGLMAAVDEIVFHQLLGWHHFYDRSTSRVALLSDGVLHSAELVLLVAGAFALRYGVDLVPYDIAWIGAAVLLLLAGAVVAARSRREARAPGPERGQR